MRKREPPVTGEPLVTGGDAGRPGLRWPRSLAARLRGASRSSRIALGTGAVLVALLVAAAAIAASSGGAVPRSAPPAAKPFTLKALGHPSRTVSLSGYAGRPVIVNFFASWCAPCKQETPLLARFYRSEHGRIAVIGVDANDQAGPAERFVRDAGVTYPVGVDPFPASVTTSYGVDALPQTFFLNAGHRIVKRVIGEVTMKELTAGASLMSGGRKSLAAVGSRSSQGGG
jgi:cytochrome c biogenesis protein CcmG/thiol:disulfide interchange protein DsbE